jgi:hypothetical protein
MGYLLTWAGEMCGRSGVSDGGYAPLSYTTIADWSRLTRQPVSHLEVEALIAIDAAMRTPDLPMEAEPEKVQAVTPAWPERRAEPVLIRDEDG